MATRIIALAFLALFLAFAAVMASVTLFVREPLPIVGRNQTLVLTSTALPAPLRAEIVINERFEGLITVAPMDEVERVRLRPGGGTDVPLYAEGAGAEAQFTRTGRWELVLDAGGQQEVLAFVLRD